MKKGLVHIYTGKGKGKTTAAMGLATRALGYDKKVYIMQFLKGRPTGEKLFFNKTSNISFNRAGEITKFINKMNTEEIKKLKYDTKKAWKTIKNIVRKSEYDLIILDEIMGIIRNSILEIKDVVALIEIKEESEKKKELILTGRGAPEELIKIADYVTEMRAVKHPFNQSVSARRGIEF